MKEESTLVLGQYQNKRNKRDMRQKNNERIVICSKRQQSIDEARNAYTYDEIDDCYVEAKKIAEVARMELANYTGKK